MAEEKVYITPGKLRGLIELANEDGRFFMLAIDQRGSIVKMIASALGVDKKDVKFEDVVFVKRYIVKTLAPYASSILIDPEYGFAATAKYFPKNTGILLSYEETGYTEEAGARITKLLPGWSAEKIKMAGASAIKLLLYIRLDAPEDVVQHQLNLVKQVGAEAKKYDIPFVLEPVGYALTEKDDSGKVTTDCEEYAKKKPEIVLNIVKEFSKPEYGVDILKIEFPADLKFTKEYENTFGREGGKKRKPVYELKDVYEFTKKVNEAAELPWVILSAGVDIDEYLVNVQIATECGASGFLAGRAIWKESIAYVKDREAFIDHLSTRAVENFKNVMEIAKNCVPFWKHKRYKNFALVDIENAGPDWYSKYLQ